MIYNQSGHSVVVGRVAKGVGGGSAEMGSKSKRRVVQQVVVVVIVGTGGGHAPHHSRPLASAALAGVLRLNH